MWNTISCPRSTDSSITYAFDNKFFSSSTMSSCYCVFYCNLRQYIRNIINFAATRRNSGEKHKRMRALDHDAYYYWWVQLILSPLFFLKPTHPRKIDIEQLTKNIYYAWVGQKCCVQNCEMITAEFYHTRIIHFSSSQPHVQIPDLIEYNVTALYVCPI